MKKKGVSRGPQAFDDFFRSVYGDRWLDISHALLHKDCKVARANRFYSETPSLNDIFAQPEKYGVGSATEEKDCYGIEEGFHLDNFPSSLLPFYRMDPASIVAARSLPVEPGHSVLDMCAAPGGKTLVLFEAMKGQGLLVANELSAKRRHRLMGVIKRYVPAEYRENISITGRDGSRLGLEKRRFGRILIDAPCSGERGVAQKANDLAQWTEKRSRRFAITQYALLASGLLALESGGYLLYSTCSLSPHENDEVIAKLQKRQGAHFAKVALEHPKAEATEHGYQFLPDRAGWGPIFYSLLQKL